MDNKVSFQELIKLGCANSVTKTKKISFNTHRKKGNKKNHNIAKK